MQPAHSTDETDPDISPSRPRGHRRLVAIFCFLLAVLLLTFIPPLINLSRLQLRIARNISASIGRPVHFSRVSPVLLPLPGFKLENFVVDEDPAFGSEPILRAGEVRATLRISSLWHQAEFSRISLSAGDAEVAPSVNLVRNPDGHWNIEAILLQASRTQAAPTAQRFAGPARRFPYIEATGARLNLKLGQEKTPFSLNEADFALWLPEPHQWHIRLEAHPLRTDTAPGDTGTVRLEGMLGRSDVSAVSLADIPIDLQGNWRDVQLGGLSSLVFANDAGLRGDFSIDFSILGTIGQNAIAAHIKLAKARRADFIPDRMLSLDAACEAKARNSFQSFTAIECHWPPADSSDPSLLILTAELPEVSNPRTATVNLTVPALPADTFFDWLHVATPHAPAGAGTLSGVLAFAPDTAPPPAAKPTHAQQPTPPSTWSGELEFSAGSIQLDPATHRSIALSDALLRSTPPPATPSPRSHTPPAATPAPDSFDLLPISLPLGGKQPATLEGHIDDTGYILHLTGTVVCANLLELGNALPQFGEGLQDVLDKIAAATPDVDSPKSDQAPDRSDQSQNHILTSVPIHVDLTATRTWGSPQTWRETTSPAPTHRARH